MWGRIGDRRADWRARPRRTVALTASALAAAVALTSAGPAVAAGGQATPGVPPQVGAAMVATALGASQVPVALVVLIDNSKSMSHGLYQQVQKDFSGILAALAKQGPHDQLAVIALGNRNDTRVFRSLAPPPKSLKLPPIEKYGGTDIGLAFQLALQKVLLNASGFPAAGVLLLSDGKLNTADPAYNGYGAYGWAQLRNDVKKLKPMQVTGYDLPLTPNNTDQYDQDQALRHVFGTNRQQLSVGLTNLGSQLQNAVSLSARASKVAVRIHPDSGRGVRVTWSGPGLAGSGQLNLWNSSEDVQVTLTSRTKRVPLYVTGLSAKVSGLRRAVTATLPAASGLIKPGHPVTLTVHLQWQPVKNAASLGGSPPPWPGKLTLSGQVQTTYSRALKTVYRDRFSPGALTGAVSTGISATVSAPRDIFHYVLVALLILLIIAVLIAAVVARIMRLDGTLTLTRVDKVSHRPLPLPGRPWVSASTEDLIGIPGTIDVRRMRPGDPMWVRLRLEERPEASGSLADGGRIMLAGIDIVHNRDNGSPPAAGNSYRRG